MTHLRGLLYSGSPNTDEWNEYGNDSFQNTLERIWNKFGEDYDLVTRVFDDADEYTLQLWSPVVPTGDRTNGLNELQRRFEETHDVRIELVINSEYANRVNELSRRASETQKSYDEPAFRFLQILEHLRES